MDYPKLALIAIGLLFTQIGDSAAAPAAGSIFTSDDCPANCVMTLRSSGSVLVVARNAAGAVFRTLSFSIPENAVLSRAGGPHNGSHIGGAGRHSSHPASATQGGQCQNLPGLCTESSVRVYSTPSQYIFFTYTYVYQDGNLVHIDVEETRVPRGQIK